jgi:NADH-quinone oxidoreductase subunit I
VFGYIWKIIKGLFSLLAGLFVTFKYMFTRPITIQYPKQRAQIPLRFRGRLALPVDAEKGENRCTACMLCVKACPNHSIDVEKLIDAEGKPRPRAGKYIYNIGTCMFCNLCVEACPFYAIVMSDEYELATTDRKTLIVDLVPEHRVLEGPKAAWWQNKFKPIDKENT